MVDQSCLVLQPFLPAIRADRVYDSLTEFVPEGGFCEAGSGLAAMTFDGLGGHVRCGLGRIRWITRAIVMRSLFSER